MSTVQRLMPTSPTRRERIVGALAHCAQPVHLRRTLLIALVVGVILTAVNQGAVIVHGDATLATWVRSGLNFVVPFCVSNLGLLSAWRRGGDAITAATPEATERR